jgi:hypothetical protein
MISKKHLIKNITSPPHNLSHSLSTSLRSSSFLYDTLSFSTTDSPTIIKIKIENLLQNHLQKPHEKFRTAKFNMNNG